MSVDRQMKIQMQISWVGRSATFYCLPPKCDPNHFCTLLTHWRLLTCLGSAKTVWDKYCNILPYWNFINHLIKTLSKTDWDYYCRIPLFILSWPILLLAPGFLANCHMLQISSYSLFFKIYHSGPIILTYCKLWVSWF